jgi:hypothetical protein
MSRSQRASVLRETPSSAANSVAGIHERCSKATAARAASARPPLGIGIVSNVTTTFVAVDVTDKDGHKALAHIGGKTSGFLIWFCHPAATPHKISKPSLEFGRARKHIRRDSHELFKHGDRFFKGCTTRNTGLLTGSSNPSRFEVINKFSLRRLRPAALAQFLEPVGCAGANRCKGWCQIGKSAHALIGCCWFSGRKCRQYRTREMDICLRTELWHRRFQFSRGRHKIFKVTLQELGLLIVAVSANSAHDVGNHLVAAPSINPMLLKEGAKRSMINPAGVESKILRHGQPRAFSETTFTAIPPLAIVSTCRAHVCIAARFSVP